MNDSQQSSTPVYIQSELRAQEIFEHLLQGRKIRIPLSSYRLKIQSLDEETLNLLNQLNVIKSRAKNLYLGLGLNWEESTITKEIFADCVILSLDARKEPKKYSVYVII